MLQFYKYLSLALISLLFAFSSFAQIHSTSIGGDWDEEDTWIGGVIPGAGHDVVINGTVNCYASDQCNNITITSSGALQNDYYSGTLIVNGNITNNGSIHNYTNYLYVNIKGNITNNGTWSNYYTKLNGSLDQTITCYGEKSFSGYQFVVDKPSGDVDISGLANFENCEVWMYDNHLNLLANSTINIHNKFLRDCIIYGDGTTSIIHGVGAYNSDAPSFTDVDFNDLSITGEGTVYSGCSTHGTVINNGILANDYYSATFSLYDDFINNGSLINFTNYLYLDIYGNFTNNDIADNHSISFKGGEHQFISLAAGKVFGPNYWTVNKTGGSIEALTDIYFENVTIDWNYTPLIAQNNKLINMSGGSFSEGIVEANDAKSGYFTYHSENDATTGKTTFTNATLTGLFRCDTENNFMGTTTNNGIFENNYYSHTAHLYGHFINNGTIKNYINHLTLNIYGDFTNNNVVDHQNMYFYGDADQNISLLEGEVFSPSFFQSNKPSGNIVALTDLKFSYTNINMVDDILLFQDDGTLSLIGGYITNATLMDTDSPNGYLHLHLTKEAYINYSIVTNPEILGKVEIANDITFLGDILVTDTLRNDWYSYTLNIDGNIVNNGIIQNYSNAFSIYISGDVTNNGIWQNSYTYLNGSADQHITCLNGNRFSGYQFLSSNTDAVIYLDTQVGFDNTQVRIQGNNVELPENSTLLLHDSYLTDCNLFGNGETSVVHGEGEYHIDGPYMINTTLEDIKLTGDWGFSSGNILNGTIINDGRMQNDWYSYTLVVNAEFINNGTIRSYANYFTLQMFGNFTNNGIWAGHAIDLHGDTDQAITLTEGLVFNPTYFTSFKPSGNIIALTDLTFENTYVNFEYDPLIMPDNGTLKIDNRHLIKADISAETDRFNLFFLNEAYLQQSTFHDVNLYGAIDMAHTNSFYGTSINYGTLRNDYYSYTVDFYGDLINNGSIENYSGGLYLNAHADITNNGTWSNFYTTMMGTTDQYIHLKNGHWIDGQMRILSDVQNGNYQWYWNTWPIQSLYPDPDPFSGYTSATLQFNTSVSSTWLGTFKCWSNGTFSRNIIVDQESSLQLDITAFLEGPFNGTNMNADLNAILPLQQTLNSIGYEGPEAVSAIPNADIVDWIGVELRDAADASLATEATSLGGGAFFIRNDGKIVGLDGSSLLNFDITINQNLYVLLWPRNHLPIMSMTAVPQSGGIYTYDFTTAASQAYGNNQSNLGGGKFGLIGGNANGDGNIDELDGIESWYPQVGQAGYLSGDVNMDGQVNNQDKNETWLPNYGKSIIIPE